MLPLPFILDATPQPPQAIATQDLGWEERNPRFQTEPTCTVGNGMVRINGHFANGEVFEYINNGSPSARLFETLMYDVEGQLNPWIKTVVMYNEQADKFLLLYFFSPTCTTETGDTIKVIPSIFLIQEVEPIQTNGNRQVRDWRGYCPHGDPDWLAPPNLPGAFPYPPKSINNGPGFLLNMPPGLTIIFDGEKLDAEITEEDSPWRVNGVTSPSDNETALINFYQAVQTKFRSQNSTSA